MNLRQVQLNWMAAMSGLNEAPAEVKGHFIVYQRASRIRQREAIKADFEYSFGLAKRIYPQIDDVLDEFVSSPRGRTYTLNALGVEFLSFLKNPDGFASLPDELLRSFDHELQLVRVLYQAKVADDRMVMSVESYGVQLRLASQTQLIDWDGWHCVWVKNGRSYIKETSVAQYEVISHLLTKKNMDIVLPNMNETDFLAAFTELGRWGVLEVIDGE